MPKFVDHEERRRELAEAAWRVILRDGIEGVSVRKVATEANLSAGALRHYFASKEELLFEAARLMLRRLIDRFERRPAGKTPYEDVRVALSEVLLDEERNIEASVWFAFAAHSLMEPRLATEYEAFFHSIGELCSRITGRLFDGGWLTPGLEPKKEAARLHALVEGLFVQQCMGSLDKGAALTVLDTHLEEIVRRRAIY